MYICLYIYMTRKDLVGVAGEANSRALMPASMLSSFIAFDVSLRQVPGLVSIFIYQYTW